MTLRSPTRSSARLGPLAAPLILSAAPLVALPASSLLLTACGGDSESPASADSSDLAGENGGANGSPSDAASSAHTDGRDESGRIVPECQGFELEGLRYSPGGDTLPNTCAPFDALTNNPYAVRCIDAMPDYETPFPGDEYCILPPPEDLGIQVGVHPQGADYWEQMWAGDYSGYEGLGEDWVLQPGEERTQNYVFPADNPEPHNYYRTYFRMRTGSHHNIITLHRGAGEPGWRTSAFGEAAPGLFGDQNGELIGVLGGQQRPDDGTPATFEKPPEDEGLFFDWPAEPDVLYNMHHFNVSTQELLREGWVNIWWEEDARQEADWYMGFQFDQVGMQIDPGEVADLHYSWTVEGDTPVRLLRVFGHRHFWTTNFTAWLERAGSSDPEIIYQSFDWEDMPTYRFDSAAENEEPNPELHIDGATEGVLTLQPGDEYHFNCHIEYTDERAADDPAAPRPAEQGTLGFANQAFGGEMCINFGNTTGGDLGRPETDDGPIPEAARQ